MSLGRRAIAAAAFLAVTMIGAAAHADDAVRVVVAGPKRDPIAARLEKEIAALGFAPVMIGAVDGCAREGILAATAAAEASAALCSNGVDVAVWTSKADGRPVELRDVVIAQEKGRHEGDQVAMRAAEIMRANVALHEPEPEEAPAATPPPAAPPLPTSLNWDDLDNLDRPTRSPLPHFTPMLTLAAGASMLASNDATSAGLSLHAAIGVHRSFALTVHADIPTGGVVVEQGAASTRTALVDSTELRVSPGVAGVGIELPLAAPSARLIPRFGVAVGATWLHADRSGGTVVDARGISSDNDHATAFVVAPAGWATVALSIAIYGPVRGVLDGLVGTAAGRLVVRDQGIARAHWGSPIGGLALRLEVLLP